QFGIQSGRFALSLARGGRQLIDIRRRRMGVLRVVGGRPRLDKFQPCPRRGKRFIGQRRGGCVVRRGRLRGLGRRRLGRIDRRLGLCHFRFRGGKRLLLHVRRQARIVGRG